MLLFIKNTRQKVATIASNSDSKAKSEMCNQSLVFSFIDEKPYLNLAPPIVGQLSGLGNREPDT